MIMHICGLPIHSYIYWHMLMINLTEEMLVLVWSVINHTIFLYI
jgi:hypothetical protein